MIRQRVSQSERDYVRPASLGEALRLLRHRTRCSRDEFARLAGTSAGAMSNYENDVSVPSAPTLRRLIRVLEERLGTNSDELWCQIGHVMDEQNTRRDS